MTDVPLLVALLAGVVSFLSPCVLPLIPGYLAYLSSTPGSTTPSSRRAVVGASIWFVIGFATVFSALGVLLNTALEAVAYDVQVWLSRLGGVVIILFGLSLLGIWRLPFLQREYHVRVRTPFQSRSVTSFLFGAAFAAGWTPCVGAVLGGILGLAASRPGSALVLLIAYSLGFGVPFILVGLFTAQANRLITRLAPWLNVINRLFGVVLIIIGILIFTQTLSRFASVDILFQQWQRLYQP
jgi:cytochrome c-type biogenesis protein